MAILIFLSHIFLSGGRNDDQKLVERVISLSSDLLRRSPRFFLPPWFEPPQAFASDFDVARQACVRYKPLVSSAVRRKWK
jgi:hypothetical protein